MAMGARSMRAEAAVAWKVATHPSADCAWRVRALPSEERAMPSMAMKAPAMKTANAIKVSPLKKADRQPSFFPRARARSLILVPTTNKSRLMVVPAKYGRRQAKSFHSIDLIDYRLRATELVNLSFLSAGSPGLC